MLKAGEYKQIAPVLFGSGMIEEAGKKAKELGVSHILLVCDDGVKKTGLDARAAKILEGDNVKVTQWSGVQTDCPDETVEEAVKIVTDNQVDGIIGIGGGSVLDTAKAIAATAANGIGILDDIISYLAGRNSMRIIRCL
ncbi:MAG: iron-containing alcohol dehydrogenase [[Clostridium] scindens]